MRLSAVPRRAGPVLAAIGGAALLSCGDAGPPPAEPAPPPAEPAPEAAPAPEPAPEAPAAADAVARGAEHYQQLCATCHGPTGDGDGPAAAGLDPKPARHSDGNYMNSLSDEYLAKVITEGGAAVGKSPTMAPWGGVLDEDDVRDVIAFIRTLADPPYTQ